jgi:hypothetical protein
MAISFKVNGGPVSVDTPEDTPPLPFGYSRAAQAHRHKIRLRFRPLWRFCGDIGGKRAFCARPDLECCRQAGDVHRGPVAGFIATCAEGLACRAGAALPVLSIRPDHERGRNPHPTRPEIVAQISGHICRCGTYPRILRVHRTRCAGGHETRHVVV